jgi:branched-subunit amino acid transport protein
MSNWLVVAVIGAGTYLTRLSFVGILGTRRLPAWAERPLRYVAPAVLAALVVPAVTLRDDALNLLPAQNPRFIAAVLAGLVTWRFKSVVMAIIIGMGTLWLLRWWF